MSTAGFINPVRETIYAALFTRVWAAYAWQNERALARRVKLWADVPASSRPALYQFEGAPEKVTWPSNQSNPKLVLEAKLFLYWSCKDPAVIGSTIMNTLLDAVFGAMVPTVPEATFGKCTLGGLVLQARIEGEVFRDPGDIDGDGMAIVPILMQVN